MYHVSLRGRARSEISSNACHEAKCIESGELVHDCDQKDSRGGFREAKNFPMIEDIAISRKRLVQDSNPNQTRKNRGHALHEIQL
jgi:hypothetical protein